MEALKGPVEVLLGLVLQNRKSNNHRLTGRADDREEAELPLVAVRSVRRVKQEGVVSTALGPLEPPSSARRVRSVQEGPQAPALLDGDPYVYL